MRSLKLDQGADPSGGPVTFATVNGTPGNDFIHVAGDGLSAPPGYNDISAATNGNDVINSGGGGNDIVFAGDGDDRIVFGSDFTGADQVDGQGGNDTVELNGDYHTRVVLQANALANIETLKLDAGHSYNFNFAHASVPNAMTVDGSALTAADSLIVDARGNSDPEIKFVGGAGDDQILSSDGVAHIDLSQGGHDTADQGAGGSFIYMGAALDVGDRISGGTIELNGDYSAGYTFGSETLKGVTFVLDGGHSYDITLADAAVGINGQVGINAEAVGAGSSVIFDASVMTSPMGFEGGAGDMTLTGGAGGGQFLFEPNGQTVFHGGAGADEIDFFDGFNPANVHIDAGAGDDVAVLFGDFNLTLARSAMVNVDTIELDGLNDTVIIPQAYLTAGATLTVDGSGARNVTIDGSAVSGASLVLKAGSGENHLIAGSGDDTIVMAGTGSAQGGAGDDLFYSFLNPNETIDGGTGTDTVVLGPQSGAGDLGARFSVHVTAQELTNVEVLRLGSFDLQTITFDDGAITPGSTLLFDASSLTPGHGVTFDGHAETHAHYIVVMGAADDSIMGGQAGDDLSGGDGNDKITGGHGNDVFEGGTGNDFIIGGGGDDTIRYSHATGGVTVDLSLVGAQNVGGGQGSDTLASIRSVIGSNFDDVLKGTSDDNFLEGLGGNDTLNGGSGNDTADYTHATGGVTVDLNITAGQNVGGGAGIDTLISIENLRGSEFADTLKGASGGNVLSGQDGNDTLDLSSGGNDTALGGNGDDMIVMGAALTASDIVDGGAGTDTVTLNGDYSAGLIFTATTMVNVETISLASGHSYKLTAAEATVAGGQTLTVNASQLGSGNTLTFDGSAEHDGSFAITGGAGNDIVVGGAGNDVFSMGKGGDDTVSGGGGNDVFAFDAAFNANDRIDGGSGNDTLTLNGDYSAGVVFGAATMVNVETVVLASGHSYKLTTNDATDESAAGLTVDASALGAADALIFNGAAETDDFFKIVGGAGNDVLTGGGLADTFDLTHGGNDTVSGGAGGDAFLMGATLTAADKIDGGAGADGIVLDGDYSAGLVFAAATMTNVEILSLTVGHSYKLTLSDGNVAAGMTLTVKATALGAGDSLTFNGSAEHDGAFVVKGGKGDDHIIGGDGADKLTGGKGNDVLQGGNGADLLNGARGNDVFAYTAAGQSTGPVFDTITGFSARQDKIDVWFSVTGVDAAVSHGALSLASFNSDLAAALGAAQLAGDHAVVFTPDSGDFAGDTFLVVDANGAAGYQAGQDLVIELDHAAHLNQLKVADFI